MGRPSSINDEIAQIILDRIANGESLLQICGDDDMPDRGTVRRWEDSDPSFAARCARAREHQGDTFVDKMGEVYEKLENGAIESDVARALQANLEWRASKLNRQYGNVVKNEHTGANGGPIVTETRATTEDELEARIHELSNKTRKD